MPKPVSPEEIMIAKEASTTSSKHTPYNRLRKRLLNEYNKTIPQVLLGGMLMLSLFMAESWTLGNAPDSDNDGLYATLLAIFVIFALETVFLSFVQDGYFNSFFFYMDVIGTISIILDIGWIADTFLPSGALQGQGSVIRATRTAKLGARYGRLLRLIKIMRVMRYLPCFNSGASEEFEPTMSAIKRVSNELSNVLSNRTAALVLIIVIVLPFMTYTVTDYSPQTWLDNYQIIAKNSSITMWDVTNIVANTERFYRHKDSSVLYIEFNCPYVETSQYIQEYKTRDVLREDSIVIYEDKYYVDAGVLLNSSNPYAAANVPAGLSGDDRVYFGLTIKVDQTVQNQQNSMFGILIIILVIVMLFTFTASFNSAVNTLVVMPLEKMMTTLRTSAMQMIKSMRALSHAKEEEEEGKEEGKSKKKRKGEEGYQAIDDDSSESDEQLETAMLEKMVEKLSRIVKHVLPPAPEILVDENVVDKATAAWLNNTYAVGPSRSSIKEHASVDEGAERLRLKAIEESQSLVTREKLDSWEFDVLEYTHEQLIDIYCYLFNILNYFSEFNIPMLTFRAFMNELANRYINSNTYHNFKHGCDVAHTSYRMVMIPQFQDLISSLEFFSLLLASLAHDVGHPGVNNNFLIAAKHELALLHNDKSPLENMHCAVLYELLSKEATNILINVTNDQWKEMRKIILKCILGTDMMHHTAHVKTTELYVEVHGEDFKAYCSGASDELTFFNENNNRETFLELVLHTSDISNPFKPYAVCEKWAVLVTEEFCVQGDKEKALQLNVTFDRATMNLCNAQLGFIEFMVAPYIIAIVKWIPSLHEIASNMLNNYQSWGERKKLEVMNSDGPADKPEECRKLDERMNKFATRFAFLNQMRDMPSRKRKSVSSSY